MPEELVIRHCSPTLAGLKTGNMFSYSYESREEVSIIPRSSEMSFLSSTTHLAKKAFV